MLHGFGGKKYWVDASSSYKKYVDIVHARLHPFVLLEACYLSPCIYRRCGWICCFSFKMKCIIIIRHSLFQLLNLFQKHGIIIGSLVLHFLYFYCPAHHQIPSFSQSQQESRKCSEGYGEVTSLPDPWWYPLHPFQLGPAPWLGLLLYNCCPICGRHYYGADLFTSSC